MEEPSLPVFLHWEVLMVGCNKSLTEDRKLPGSNSSLFPLLSLTCRLPRGSRKRFSGSAGSLPPSILPGPQKMGQKSPWVPESTPNQSHPYHRHQRTKDEQPWVLPFNFKQQLHTLQVWLMTALTPISVTKSVATTNVLVSDDSWAGWWRMDHLLEPLSCLPGPISCWITHWSPILLGHNSRWME